MTYSQTINSAAGGSIVAQSIAQQHAVLLGKIGQNQDKKAFEMLFTHFAPKVKALMLKMDRDNELAEELTQETMLTVWKKAHLFSNWKGSPSAWIFTIARNNRIDRFRKQSISHYTDISEVEIEDEKQTTGEAELMNAQRDQAVAEVRDQLPADQLEVIQLSFEQNLAQSEIAEKLNIPLGTVKSRMRLAYKKMKSKLEDVR